VPARPRIGLTLFVGSCICIDRDKFIARLTEHFPKIAESIDDIRAGLLHPETAVFAHATEAAMLTHETEVVREHFDFAKTTCISIFSGHRDQHCRPASPATWSSFRSRRLRLYWRISSTLNMTSSYEEGIAALEFPHICPAIAVEALE